MALQSIAGQNYRQAHPSAGVLVWTGALTARATNRYHKAPLPYPPVERSSRPAMVSLNAGLGTLAARAYELLDAVGHPVAAARWVTEVSGPT